MKTASDRMKGKKYFLDGNLPASIKSFTKALGKEPGSPEILLGRGAAYLKLGRFDKAVQDLSKVLDGGGDCERAFFLRGIAYLNASEFEQALADLNRALECNRKRGAAILARGLGLSSMGRHKEAKRDFTNSYVLDSIIIDEFLEEYAISEALFKQAMELFNVDTGEWKLLLTEDEMAKMEIAHY
jgi:tetratricopeptide (TPR) repeat protein